MKLFLRRYKRSVVVSLAVVTFLLSGFVIQRTLSNMQNDFKDDKPVGVVEEEDKDIPVNGETEETLIYPFTGDVKMVRFFYNSSDNEEKRALSMTSFEGVFRPNQGVDFSNDAKIFDILSSFSGTVTDKREDSIFGWTVTITNETGLKATYQSLADVTVEKGAAVKQGDKLGNSGENIYNKDLGVHLHFVLELNGNLLNPETNFNLKLSEIK